MGLYPFEKLLCGLTDMAEYADRPEAFDILDKVLPYAVRTFDRKRTPAGPTPWAMHSGDPLEWYTMPENYPYRMYVDLKDVPFELWKA
jgi:hypothetical protein